MKITKFSFFWKSTVLTLALLMNFVLAYSLLFGKQNVFVWQGLHNKYDNLLADLEKIDFQKAELSQQIRLLHQDPLYLEQVIRQKLNYVKENEILYVLEKEETNSSYWTN